MKFVLESATKTVGRRGILSSIDRLPGKSFKTPLLLLIDHNLSREVLEIAGLRNSAILLPYDGTEQMTAALKVYKKGIAEFSGLKESLTFVTIKNTTEPTTSGHHEKNKVPIFRKAGKLFVGTDDYMDFIEAAQPDFYVSLADGDTWDSCSKKRATKANERSEEMLDKCLEYHKNNLIPKNIQSQLIASIEGGYNVFERRKSTEYAKQFDDHIPGYFIDGFHRNGSEATKLDMKRVIDIVQGTIANLPENKMRIMFGAYPPVLTLELISQGIDIFDSSFVNLATKMNRALTFSFDLGTAPEQHPVEPEINLMDQKYKDDFTPFLENCECLACKQHTKAYTNHLLITKELLGPMLLTIHNIHHYSRFFEVINQSIEEGRLNELKDLIKKQYENLTLLYDPPVAEKLSKNNDQKK